MACHITGNSSVCSSVCSGIHQRKRQSCRLQTLCERHPHVTGWFPSERASNAMIMIDMPHFHDDVINWKHFPHNWPFVRGIHRSPVNSPHKGQWRGALMFSLICAWINDWVNNREAGDLRRNRVHYDVSVMFLWSVLQRGGHRTVRRRSGVYLSGLETWRWKCGQPGKFQQEARS